MRIMDACAIGLCKGDRLHPLFGVFEEVIQCRDFFVGTLSDFSEFGSLGRTGWSSACKSASNDSDLSNRGSSVALCSGLWRGPIIALVRLCWLSGRGVSTVAPSRFSPWLLLGTAAVNRLRRPWRIKLSTWSLRLTHSSVLWPWS